MWSPIKKSAGKRFTYLLKTGMICVSLECVQFSHVFAVSIFFNFIFAIQIYLLFLPTNAHKYIKILNYITKAPTRFGAFAPSSGSFDIAFIKFIKCENY